MTLDEAIKHCEEVADLPCISEAAKKCYAEHRQLAEWLKDYKRMKEQEPRKGHWIYDQRRDWDGMCAYECSECGMGSDVDYAYCMRCGAKMVEPQESEEI